MEDIVYFGLFIVGNLSLLPIFRSVKAWRDGDISENYLFTTVRICVSITLACLWGAGVITLLDPAMNAAMSFAVLGTAAVTTIAQAGLKERKISTTITKDARGLESHQVINVR